ncbi:MAG: hypothetical protein ABI042_08305 [Verrucomicrobiota bacterium]
MNTMRTYARLWISIDFLLLCSGPIILNLWPELSLLVFITFLTGDISWERFQSKSKLKVEKVGPGERLAELLVVFCRLMPFGILLFALHDGKKLDPFITAFWCLLNLGPALSMWISVRDMSEEELRSSLKNGSLLKK